MSKADEPAFPTIASRDEDLFFSLPGLTKREYFAGLAMQGICAAKDEVGELIHHGYEWIAISSVKVADALLAELEKKDE